MAGALLIPGKGVEFSVWAPFRKQVFLKLLGEPSQIVPMDPVEEGYFRLFVPDLPAGRDYLFLLDGSEERSDPVSRWQPDGVLGPSRVLDPFDFSWTDANWTPLPLKEYIIYELHTGTFTPEGTFEGIIAKLPYLRELGITAIEIMPVASFPGERNWGYDGVYLYAPQESYGGPYGLKKLVNACHQEGLAVVLDVVYNHIGPEGNYLADFGPYYTDRYKTPWGLAMNYDGPNSQQVRQYVINNALYWFEEYHVDALRLDAIQTIFDSSGYHLLEELHDTVAGKGLLIAESNLNDVRILNPKEMGGYHLDGQWSDDFHHALRAILTGSRHIYLIDFGQLADLAKAITDSFVYDYRWSNYMQAFHGNSSKERPGEQFVVCIENHDQIANLCRGQRLSKLVTTNGQQLAAAILFFTPNIPLLYMGQEMGADTPFYFFTSYSIEKYIQAVREGRRKEHPSTEPFPDPQDEKTFWQSKLNWSNANPEIVQFYRTLLSLRKSIPALSNCRKDLTEVSFDETARWLVVKRQDPGGSQALLAANFSDQPQTIPLFPGNWTLRLTTGEGPYGVQIYT